MPEVRHAVVYADYFQFYVQDADAHDEDMRSGGGSDPDRPPAGWTSDSERTRIGVEPHSISVGTARRDYVETTLEIHPSIPPVAADAEHVVEADVLVSSGAISVVGCLTEPGPEHRAPVAAGSYRLRVSFARSELPAPGSDTEGLGGHFIYRMDIWLSPASAPVTVIKQGPVPWG